MASPANRIRVAAAQMEVSGDVGRNVSAIVAAVRRAASEGADILLTPEGSLSGYTARFDAAAVAAGLGEVTALARELGVGLALGTCFTEADGRTHNQLRFHARDGAFLGFHSKMLRCGPMDGSPAGEIADFATADLRTFEFAGMRVGGLICNDLWANPGCTPMPDPHLTQQLSRMGARVIFHAVNGGRDGSEWSQVAWRYHEANLRMRAAAARVWIVTVDNCGPVSIRCSAPSGVVAPDGSWACRSKPQGEDFFMHTVDLGGGCQPTK
jgi:predicted amidohydrolase